MSPGLASSDPEIAALIQREAVFQAHRLDLVASDNHVSAAQLEACAGVLADNTVEGYPGARFLAASRYVDGIERLAMERACHLFKCRFANVQPHSGTQANQAVMLALLKPGDRLLSMQVSAGGHFSHGEPGTLSGQWFDARHYGVHADTGLIDYDEVRSLAQRHRPRLIIAGASAYPRAIDFESFAQIAREVDATLMVDMAHVAGLVASGHFPDPVPHADVVTSTTYKNLPGVHGGLMLCNDETLAARLDAALCPGLQGTVLFGMIAAKAVAFREASQPAFRAYGEQVLRNARSLGAALQTLGIPLLTGGTDTPFVIADLRSHVTLAAPVVAALDALGIGSNAAPLPHDGGDFSRARGLRLGVNAITTRGMTEKQCERIAHFVAQAVQAVARGGPLPTTVGEAVLSMCQRYPPPLRGNDTAGAAAS
ncbi:MAG: serine hydroxymethyltransferase [Rubrivivax sp.]